MSRIEYDHERQNIEMQFADHTRVLSIEDARSIRDKLEACIKMHERMTAPNPDCQTMLMGMMAIDIIGSQATDSNMWAAFNKVIEIARNSLKSAEPGGGDDGSA